MSARPKVVVASPHKIEREMLADWLTSDGLEPVCVSSALAAVHGLNSRLYELVVADAGFAFADGVHTASRGAHTPAIVVGDPGGSDEMRAARNGAMYVTRPVDRAAFMCSVSLALVDGRTPRRSPRKALAKTPVTVDGQPSFLIDVSNEGLRLEIPRRGANGPSPSTLFIVNVPKLGVALSVQRVWVASAPPGAGAAAWCGAALASNSSRAEHTWRSFVASVPAS